MPFNQKPQKFNAKINTVTVGTGDKAVTVIIKRDREHLPRTKKSLIVQEDVSKFNAISLEARDIKIKIKH